MRSDREEIPEPFTKADADKAETMEARISTARLTAGCQVYWPSPFEVCGAIKDKYNSLGGPSSFLLWPTSAELTNPNNSGKRTQFLNGPIYWSAANGAHPVVNSFLNRWGFHGYEAGWMGYPTTDEIVNPDGIGRRQEFQGAAIYWHPTAVPQGAVIGGSIRNKWNTVGAETATSLLGYPTGDEIVLPDGKGRMNSFQRGTIYWRAAYGAHPVVGAILAQWAAAGYEQSEYGYPTSDQYPVTSGTVQDFQGLKIGSGLDPVADEPTDWSIKATFVGKDGDDLPLRIGRKDTMVQVGFGWRHLIAREHFWEGNEGAAYLTIEEGLDGCKPGVLPNADGKVRCEKKMDGNDAVTYIVIYTTRVDTRSMDSRPVGILSAYIDWDEDCGC